ncbi:L-lactate dehydrogenase (cytochrome) [Azospirillum brasilense]|uniref:L-lactate dehydrogenase (Cytochrome) n=1 Tax=Azospirillum brasilense TaxID=192 RepID=A0A560BCF3_AZOBR|nr:alpha-hydroxy acid oxidase [Azospirillum brasilense]TWA70212.1 L-lactate dehydrogenase (cytochrome) [Azospirillum brasilense]
MSARDQIMTGAGAAAPAGAAKPAGGWGTGGLSTQAARLRRRFPTVADLAAQARRRTPRFAYDFVSGGVNDDLGLARNRRALDAIEIVPRYGLDVRSVTTETTLFGRGYALPVGVAPMGLAGLLWPDADESIARAAQRARIPYVMSTVANTSIERIAAIAPDVFWYQLYNVPENDHAVSLDLIRRAQAAGAHALVLTMDVPVRSKRVRDVRNGLVVPFRPTLRTAWDVARAPGWALAMLRKGQPRFHNFEAYLGPDASTADLASFVFQKMTGPLTWESVARFRDAWTGPLIVKGILHPDDAETAVALGADGILVSNHGGRQFDAAPATASALPAIVERVGGRATVLVDGSISSGLDLLRVLGRGAVSAFAGRAFLMAYAAAGEDGVDHVVRLFTEELRVALAQSGAAALGVTLGAAALDAAPGGAGGPNGPHHHP